MTNIKCPECDAEDCQKWTKSDAAYETEKWLPNSYFCFGCGIVFQHTEEKLMNNTDKILEFLESIDDFDTIQRELSRKQRIAQENKNWDEYHKLAKIKNIITKIEFMETE